MREIDLSSSLYHAGSLTPWLIVPRRDYPGNRAAAACDEGASFGVQPRYRLTPSPIYLINAVDGMSKHFVSVRFALFAQYVYLVCDANGSMLL